MWWSCEVIEKLKNSEWLSCSFYSPNVHVPKIKTKVKNSMKTEISSYFSLLITYFIVTLRNFTHPVGSLNFQFAKTESE